MNARLQQLIDRSFTDHQGEQFDPERFAELLVKECIKLNKEQSHELSGVIIDTEHGDGFDETCLDTVKRVYKYLAIDGLKQHFGVEE